MQPRFHEYDRGTTEGDRMDQKQHEGFDEQDFADALAATWVPYDGWVFRMPLDGHPDVTGVIQPCQADDPDNKGDQLFSKEPDIRKLGSETTFGFWLMVPVSDDAVVTVGKEYTTCDDTESGDPVYLDATGRAIDYYSDVDAANERSRVPSLPEALSGLMEIRDHVAADPSIIDSARIITRFYDLVSKKHDGLTLENVVRELAVNGRGLYNVITGEHVRPVRTTDDRFCGIKTSTISYDEWWLDEGPHSATLYEGNDTVLLENVCTTPGWTFDEPERVIELHNKLFPSDCDRPIIQLTTQDLDSWLTEHGYVDVSDEQRERFHAYVRGNVDAWFIEFLDLEAAAKAVLPHQPPSSQENHRML